MTTSEVEIRLAFLFAQRSTGGVKCMRGFRWSPSEGAWQRQLNSSAIYIDIYFCVIEYNWILLYWIAHCLAIQLLIREVLVVYYLGVFFLEELLSVFSLLLNMCRRKRIYIVFSVSLIKRYLSSPLPSVLFLMFSPFLGISYFSFSLDPRKDHIYSKC